MTLVLDLEARFVLTTNSSKLMKLTTIQSPDKAYTRYISTVGMLATIYDKKLNFLAEDWAWWKDIS
ncbi:MAG: hypothetical protein ACR9NN_02795 [Nostochopsis sp.]